MNNIRLLIHQLCIWIGIWYCLIEKVWSFTNYQLDLHGSCKMKRTQMESYNGDNIPRRPLPNMPSQTFITLTESQFELLSNCLVYQDNNNGGLVSKVKSMALYLPQENQYSGQLEFLPAVIYPSPQSERVFIATDAETGLPPTIPQVLTKLPGFAHAQTLLPAYPFTSRSSSSDSGFSVDAGEVEEVMCDTGGSCTGATLSVPLYHGSRTVGVLLTWPAPPPACDTESQDDNEVTSSPFSPPWTKADGDQIKRAAYSLGVALQMDVERTASQTQTDQLRVALAENLHQVRNPLQALRTFGKLLQRKIALEEQLYENDNNLTPYIDYNSNTAMILSIAENMMLQSDRVNDLLKPMDSLVLYDRELQSDTFESRKALMPSPVMEYHRNLTSVGESETYDNVDDDDNFGIGNYVTFTRKEIPKMEGSMIQPNIGDLNIEIGFFPDVIQTILSAGEVIAVDNDIEFDLEISDDLPGVLVCPKSLQEALSNIINNALKYVKIGKKEKGIKNVDPKVKVIIAPNPNIDKAGVSILIADNGPGIPKEQWEMIFQRGNRGDSYVADQVDGTGIGLDVSLSLISRMGGLLEILDNEKKESIGLISSEYDGALFRIMLFRDSDL